MIALTLAATVLAGAPRVQQDLPPTLDMWRMYQYIPSGDLPVFNFGDLVVAFPPAGAAKYEMTISKDGTQLASTDFSAMALQKYGKFTRLRPNGNSNVNLTGAGEYSIKVSIDGKVLRTVNFAVSSSSSSDPFAPGASLDVTGPWSKYGAIISDPARPDEAAKIAFYSQVQESGAGSPAKLSVAVMKGSTVVAGIRPYTLSSKRWQIQEIPLYTPDNKNFVKQKDLVALNAPFEVIVKLNDKIVKRFSGKSEGQKLVGLPATSMTFEKTEDILMPRTIEYPGGSDNRAVLLDVYWMEANK